MPSLTEPIRSRSTHKEKRFGRTIPAGKTDAIGEYPEKKIRVNNTRRKTGAVGKYPEKNIYDQRIPAGETICVPDMLLKKTFRKRRI